MYYTDKTQQYMRTQVMCRNAARVFYISTCSECYYSVIHSLGFFICSMIEILHMQNNKIGFSFFSYSDKTWVFDQAECALGPIYFMMINKYSQLSRKRPPLMQDKVVAYEINKQISPTLD